MLLEIEWLSGSSDLTPLNFHWNHLENKVFDQGVECKLTIKGFNFKLVICFLSHRQGWGGNSDFSEFIPAKLC